MDKNIIIREDKTLPEDKLQKLYDNNGWILYTNDMKKLVRAIENSQRVLSAWKEDELIGLIRTVGDGETIVYILDILILKEYQNQGIGTELMNQILKESEGIRQKVLLTGIDSPAENLYKKTGFKPASDFNCISYMRNDI